jgi:carotenoid cleavage dioxygenase-like enzyme
MARRKHLKLTLFTNITNTTPFALRFASLVVDILHGEHLYFDVPQNAIPGEPVFIPRPQSTAEDDGVLMFAVNLEESSSSEIFILDAATLSLRTRIASPENLPYGFHGHFYPS